MDSYAAAPNLHRDDSATDVGYLHEDGQYAAVRIADISDPETIAGQLRVLAGHADAGPDGFRAKLQSESPKVSRAITDAVAHRTV